MRNYLLLLVSGLIGLCSGCHRSPAEMPLLDRPANTSALVGTWVLSKDSLPILSRYAYSRTNNVSLVFGANGSLLVSNVPLFDFRRSPKVQPLSGSGEWKLKKSYAVWVLQVEINNFYDKLDIRGQGQNLYLTTTLGDLDTGDVVVFERKVK